MNTASKLVANRSKRGAAWWALAALAAWGCQAGTLGGEQPGPPSVATIGAELREVRELDVEGSLRAVGLLPASEADALASSEEGAGIVQPVILAVVRRDAPDQAVLPLGPEGARVLDAALWPRAGEAAFVDVDGRVCHGAAGREPECADVAALPEGLDVSAAGEVVFVADTGDGSNIWVVDPRSGAGPRRLTFGPGFRTRPLFDPSGQRVVYVGTSPQGLASLFEVDARGGESRQITNVGLALGPVGAGSRLPAGFVPPPRARAAMRWDATGVHYATASSAFRVDPATAQVEEEGLR